MTISENAGKTTEVTATAGKATNGGSIGLFVISDAGSIAISGGTVKAEGKIAEDKANSFYGDYEGMSYGIYSANALTLSGGNITASSGEAVEKSYGIAAAGAFTLQDVNMESSGENGALLGSDSFTNNNSSAYKLFVGSSISDATEWDSQTEVSGYVYAKNTNEFYTVTFDKGEGSGTMAPVVLHGGGSLNLPECDFTAPENKEFAGWKIGSETYNVDGAYPISGNTTVTAQWRGVPCTITYVANGGTGTMQNGIAYAGEEFTLPECGFTAAEGMQFKAWSIDGKEYAVGAGCKFTTDTDVTAVWEKKKYSVTYVADGTTLKEVIVEHGKDVAISDVPTVPTKEGYDQTAPTWDNDGSNVTANRTINAVYTPNIYEITYDANGGTGSMNSAEVFVDGTYTLADCAFTAPENQKFKAWKIGDDLYAEGAQITIEGNVTVKAVWEENPFDYQMISVVPTVFKGTGTVVATANGDFDKFTKVLVDNKEIRKDVDYTAVSGSTIVTLQEAYLKTLEAGQHTVTIVYTDGEVSGYFAVEEATAPTPEPTTTPAPTQKPTTTPAPTQKPADTPAPTAAPVATPAPVYTSPKTGVDAMGMVVAMIIMLVAACGMLVCTRKKN